MGILISVIMGVYNAADTVCISLAAIKQQSINDIELIVCDDCSTDGTWEILTSAKREFNISVLLRNEVNKGLAYSLNRCIEHSHGEFIARMDADDWCEPERLEKQMIFLNEHNDFDLVGTQCLFVDDDGKKYEFKKPVIPDANVLPLSNPFVHPTVMIRRSSFDKLGGYTVSKKTRRCEDLELWYRFFYLGFKGYNLQEYLYYKKRGKDSYRRRKFRYGIDMFIIHIRGMRKLHMKWYKYFLALKPIISSMVPRRVMILYHKIVFTQMK